MAMTDSDKARPVAGISSMAMRHVLNELSEDYLRQSGQPVLVTAVGGVDAVRRIRGGEAFDFAVLAADAIDDLARSGHLNATTRVDLARSSVAIAVAAGAPKLNIATEDALREAMLAARSIGCSTGPSGVHLTRLFERWGIADIVVPRIVQAPPGVPVGALVARGDVEVGFQQYSELLHVPGIDIVGMLPAAVDVVTVFAAAACTAAREAAAVRAVLTFFASAAGDAAKRRHGMIPARTDD
ncbi:MAG TPA: substrate-binding domain-containing protein [Vicinamibacterales bacterium]|nr:substrate-binding domain-containing protein [Vicinamibacterales bacterium]